MLKNITFLLIISILIPLTNSGCASDKKSAPRKKIRPVTEEKTNLSKREYQQEPSVQLEFDEYSIMFAFSNIGGKEILAISDTLPDPTLYTHTISEDGIIIPVNFKEKKTGDADKEFQQVYSNFSNCGGYLFEAVEKKVNYKKVNVLLTDKFLEKRKYIRDIKPEKKPLEKYILDTLAAQKGKTIKNSFPIVRIDNKASLYAVNYELTGDSAMFSFVLVKENKLVIKDNFGEFDPAGTWRAGDKGYVKPEMFDVLAVFEGENGIELAIDWIGSEGDYIEYLMENGNLLEMTKNEYRYTLPN